MNYEPSWKYQRFNIFSWLSWGWAVDEWSLLFSIDWWDDGFSLYFLCFYVDFGSHEVAIDVQQTFEALNRHDHTGHTGEIVHTSGYSQIHVDNEVPINTEFANDAVPENKNFDPNFPDRFQVKRRRM